MDGDMSSRFTIKAKHIRKPLTFSATAKKYGLRAAEAAEIRAFISSATDDDVTTRGKAPVKVGDCRVARKVRSSRSAKRRIHPRRRQSV